MDLYESLNQNIKFLLIEVEKQLERTARYAELPSKELVGKVRSSDDYIDNLKTFIQTKCFTLAARTDASDKVGVAKLKAFEVVSVNLERISDFCERVIDQVGHLEDVEVLSRVDFRPFFEQVLSGVRHLADAIETGDVQEALLVCRAESELDALYSKMLRHIIRELSAGAHAQTQVTLLFISHYLERMGDSLLNGGEALLSARLGERIKLDQLRSLEESLEDIESEIEDVSMHAVGETKSGARIARLTAREGKKSVIFKEGKTSKLAEERESIQLWQRLMPGIAPDIYSFQEEGPRSAILFEYLPGRTFEAHLLEASTAEMELALRRITETASEVWRQTAKPGPTPPRFINQLKGRLEDVRAVHPDFLSPGGMIGEAAFLGYEDLVDRCAHWDTKLAAPHSVFIHGDFNLDNVIYDGAEDRVRFIDLHRSRDMDYCQDVSVFIVSNYRLQAFEEEIRRRINWVANYVFDFAKNYARDSRDDTFEIRIALGLARSFATSTRFVLDEALATDMFQRSRFILSAVNAHGDEDARGFVFPREVLRD